MEKYGRSFKQLSRKEKRNHIWSYYRLHILATVVGVAIIFSFLNHYLFNPPKESGLDLTLLSEAVNQETYEVLRQQLVSQVETATDNKTAVVEHLSTYEQLDPQQVMVTQSKLVGKISTEQLDIVVVNEQYRDFFLENEVVIPLTEYLSSEQLTSFSLYRQDGVAYYVEVNRAMAIGQVAISQEPLYIGIYQKERPDELAQLVHKVFVDLVSPKTPE